MTQPQSKTMRAQSGLMSPKVCAYRSDDGDLAHGNMVPQVHPIFRTGLARSFTRMEWAARLPRERINSEPVQHPTRPIRVPQRRQASHSRGATGEIRARRQKAA